MADLQVQIEELDEQISDAEDDSASTRIKAGVTGRVKAIFGEKDADVVDVMYVSAPENGTMETVEAVMTNILMERFEDDDGDGHQQHGR